jgi:hypothetical protein
MAMREGVEIKHISWFVWGALAEWAKNVEIELRQEFVDSTTAIVLAYVRGERLYLDGSLHDMQCVIASEAKKLFSIGGLRG